mmetsp:Transcript_31780/g.66616  ORF Transcript_31780/g.66616 Transcript_31780/m.66616 type:complete len:93 (-) Transcript_31780:379-657(-)
MMSCKPEKGEDVENSTRSDSESDRQDEEKDSELSHPSEEMTDREPRMLSSQLSSSSSSSPSLDFDAMMPASKSVSLIHDDDDRPSLSFSRSS